MIPSLVRINGSPWTVLPPGVHQASLQDVEESFATNSWRRELFDGLVEASLLLKSAGCSLIYLDGSYVSAKPKPGDYDACWDHEGVDPYKLDPVFLIFNDGRAAQKAAFKGEFFPAAMTNTETGPTFIDFFQVDRFTGTKKGILSISLTTDPVLMRKVQS